ncbi:MAG: oxidoreductase precursor [Nitrospira sp.]|jgi:protein-disulfide isomerase|nr:oxidoreductase precursor [Nitrospira sp.]
MTLSPKPRLWRILPLVILCIAGSLLMFSKTASPTKLSDAPDSRVIATVGNHAITLREAERRIALPLYKLDQQRSQLLLLAVQQLIDAELLRDEATRTGMTVEQLVGTPPFTFRSDSAYPIDTHLPIFDNTKSLSERRQTMIVALRRQTTIQLDLPRITEPVLAVSTDDDPSTGPTAAPVTIVEFSDFQCPFCKRSAGVVKEVLRAYGEKVRFVYRDYPTPNHIHAQQAAEAAQCAGAQGKFWVYHDLLFEHQQTGLGWDFNGLAQQASMDMAAFSHCLDTHEYASEVEADLRDALNVGVTSTPTFFINGRPLIGARSFGDFKLLIDAALAEGN